MENIIHINIIIVIISYNLMFTYVTLINKINQSIIILVADVLIMVNMVTGVPSLVFEELSIMTS